MTETLVRLFVKNSRDTTDPAVRTAYGNLASWVGIFCNLLLCAGKFVAGTLSGSISIAADAVNNLSDASSSVVSLIGFKLGARPADDEHPYGHARFEYLAGLAVAVMVLVIGVELLKSSVDKILHPAAVTFSWVAMAVLAASIAVKLWMSLFNRTLGKRINSGSLIATAADSRNDVLTTSAVLVASLISHFANVELDGWMGAAVALFIAVINWNDYYNYMMYIGNRTELQPFAWILRRMLTDKSMMNSIRNGAVSMGFELPPPMGLRMATIICAVIPIVVVYPFIQPYFTSGMTLGAVKE